MVRRLARFFLLTSMLALVLSAAAQQKESNSTNNPLAALLQAKGILTAGEVDAINHASSAEEANARLAQLLVQKGLISQQEYTATSVSPVSMAAIAPGVDAASKTNSGPRLINAVQQSSMQPPSTPTGTPPVPQDRPYIAAVAPLRVLPIDVPKQGGLIPDIRLGSGANLKLYGFFKASAISDTASSGGPTFGSQDWPLPLLLGDTGPTSDPQFHLKARSARFGGQFEWVPKNSDFTVTAKAEGDFEGDYTDVNNRNISSVRSSQFSLRIAYMRLDHKIGGTLPWFAQFGQDWSLLSTSLPSLFETTGLGLGMGTLYQRMPQFKTGVQFHAGNLKIQPEFAIVMPVAGSAALTPDQHLRFGDRAGAESNQPALEGRLVFQFPLSHEWKGVAPAQLIFSGHHARINEIIPHAAQLATSVTCTVLPCTVSIFTNPNTPNLGFNTSNSIVGATNCPEASGICNLEQFFPRGTQADNPQNIYTAEIQLPTPWFTLVAKVYRGNDMRFFFGGQLNDVFSNLHGLVDPGDALTGISESGRSILFGCAGGTTVGQPAKTINCQGTPVLSANLQPSGGSGGFAELSFPLSRIFHANPEGHNAGWVLHTEYGTDRAPASDASHGNHLGRTDLDTVSLTYRLNKWVTFVHEASYIVTFTANDHNANGTITPHYLLFAGKNARQAHDWRNEFGPVFTF
jgi:hypothetical protein